MKKIWICFVLYILIAKVNAVFVSHPVLLKTEPDDRFAYIEVNSSVKDLKVYGSNIRKIKKISENNRLIYCFNGDVGLSFSVPGEKRIYKRLFVQNGKYYRIEVLAKEPEMLDVTIKTEPDSCDVIIDDAFYGKSPLNIKLYKTLHNLSIRKDNYKEIKDSLRIESEKEYFFSLESNFMHLSVKSSPTEADVYLDDVHMGKTPLNLKLSPRKSTLYLRKKDYSDHSFAVDPDESKNIKLNVKMESKKVPVNITCDQKADLFIDGVFVSETPYSGEIFRGNHIFELVCPKFKDYKFTEDVKDPLSKHVKLEKKGFFNVDNF